ncbi:MAG: hypothetical protein N4A33_11430 [Bacteriovoracaceae bacterium]|jgi:hypothetical protein|nr:hypothetical protein [Bacteriovoracaceae bacterium]
MKKLLIGLLALTNTALYANEIALECNLYNTGLKQKASFVITDNKVKNLMFENHEIGYYTGLNKNSYFEQKPQDYRFSRFKDLKSFQNRTKIKLMVQDNCVYESGSCYKIKLSLTEMTDSYRNLFKGKLKLIQRDSVLLMRRAKVSFDAYCELTKK